MIWKVRIIDVDRWYFISDWFFFLFQAHVFFDDAFYHDENQQRTLNMFVKDFFEAINKAAG